MKRVRLNATTHWQNPDTQSIERLHAGQAIDVDDDTARRWLRNRIAKEWSGPLGVIDEGHVQASTSDLDAEIARLQELRDQRKAFEAQGLPDDDALDRASYNDELAQFDFLNEQQKVNLQRAGFTDAQRIANARDDELLQVEGVGQATIDKLRAA